MALEVRDFIKRAYQVVSANSPTVPLHGSDQSDGLYYLNQLLEEYGGTGFLLTIPTLQTISLPAGTNVITFADVGIYGRLGQIISSWLELDGTTYPLEVINTSVFENSFRYAPLAGLPQYIIYTQNVPSSQIQLYPSPSQEYTLKIRGKFSLQALTLNDDLSTLPAYYRRFLSLALAREISIYKSREDAWSELLEARYMAAKKEMIALSPIDLNITSLGSNLLNGATRVAAGI